VVRLSHKVTSIGNRSPNTPPRIRRPVKSAEQEKKQTVSSHQDQEGSRLKDSVALVSVNGGDS
jgi:hypothetical protein